MKVCAWSENRRRDHDCRRLDAVRIDDPACRQRHRVQDPAYDLAEKFARSHFSPSPAAADSATYGDPCLLFCTNG
jgi:hypothetical protein